MSRKKKQAARERQTLLPNTSWASRGRPILCRRDDGKSMRARGWQRGRRSEGVLIGGRIRRRERRRRRMMDGGDTGGRKPGLIWAAQARPARVMGGLSAPCLWPPPILHPLEAPKAQITPNFLTSPCLDIRHFFVAIFVLVFSLTNTVVLG